MSSTGFNQQRPGTTTCTSLRLRGILRTRQKRTAQRHERYGYCTRTTAVLILSRGGGEGEHDDFIVYTLYSIPCYATVVGPAGFTGGRLQQVVAVVTIHR